jgi:hypothetical protein
MADFGHEYRALVAEADAVDSEMADREQWRRGSPGSGYGDNPSWRADYFGCRVGWSERPSGFYLPDEAVDWIEAVGNGEAPEMP